MSRQIDDEEAQELKDFFLSCDADKDGLIQKSEFRALLGNLGSEISDEEASIGFSEIDRDSDGNIEFGEFLAYWRDQ